MVEWEVYVMCDGSCHREGGTARWLNRGLRSPRQSFIQLGSVDPFCKNSRNERT